MVSCISPRSISSTNDTSCSYLALDQLPSAHVHVLDSLGSQEKSELSARCCTPGLVDATIHASKVRAPLLISNFNTAIALLVVMVYSICYFFLLHQHASTFICLSHRGIYKDYALRRLRESIAYICRLLAILSYPIDEPLLVPHLGIRTPVQIPVRTSFLIHYARWKNYLFFRLIPPSATYPTQKLLIPLYILLPLNTHKIPTFSYVFPSDMEALHNLRARRKSFNKNIGDSLRRADANCEPSDPASNVTDRLNSLLKNSGNGYVLQLCPNETYLIQAPIVFASPNQEISTVGYPTDDDRAILLVSGPVFPNGTGHTTAVDGTCSTCSNLILRNIQIDGARGTSTPVNGGANIEMGGHNNNQTIEFVRSFDPRSWSCLHVTEGSLSCNNVVVQNNDIGPCGTDLFQQWADGISISCQNTIVRNNMIQGPTDGGIVLFGSPGSKVYNNTIWILNNTLLGGINMVDYEPWSGNYTGTTVYNNTILGGFADEIPDNSSSGINAGHAIIKIGIAIGPRSWFGSRYRNNVSRGGIVRDNHLSGAFSYGIAITSATNFTVQGNNVFGNSSFIGDRGPDCPTSESVPTPAPFVTEVNTTSSMSISSNFVNISDGNSLICMFPPNGGNFWPYGLNPSSASPSNSTTTATSSGGGPSGAIVGGIVLGGVVLTLLLCGLATWLRKFVLRRKVRQHLYKTH